MSSAPSHERTTARSIDSCAALRTICSPSGMPISPPGVPALAKRTALQEEGTGRRLARRSIPSVIGIFPSWKTLIATAPAIQSPATSSTLRACFAFMRAIALQGERKDLLNPSFEAVPGLDGPPPGLITSGVSLGVCRWGLWVERPQGPPASRETQDSRDILQDTMAPLQVLPSSNGMDTGWKSEAVLGRNKGRAAFLRDAPDFDGPAR